MNVFMKVAFLIFLLAITRTSMAADGADDKATAPPPKSVSTQATAAPPPKSVSTQATAAPPPKSVSTQATDAPTTKNVSSNATDVTTAPILTETTPKPTSPPNRVELEVKVTFTNEKFDDALSNNASEKFKNKAKEMKEKLKNALNQTLEVPFEKIEIIAFRNGSLIVEFKMIWALDEGKKIADDKTIQQTVMANVKKALEDRLNVTAEITGFKNLLPTTDKSTKNTKKSSLGPGAIAGIAVGSILGACALIFILVLIFKKRSHSSSVSQNTHEMGRR